MWLPVKAKSYWYFSAKRLPGAPLGPKGEVETL